ncbi:MAG: hypothetical protein ABWZ98_09340, partial [Nakamurella sp.]
MRPKSANNAFSRRWAGRLLALSAAGITAVLLIGGAGPVTAAPSTAQALAAQAAAATPNFGANVQIFDPSMPTSQIQAAVDAISA